MKSFKDKLKALPRLETPRPEPGPRPERPPEPDFRTLFPDAIPLRDDGRVHFPRPRPSPHPRRRSGTTDAPRIEHAIGWFEPATLDHAFVRSGMQSSTLKRLRARHWPVCAELDLHGLDRYQAQDRMAVFLHRARTLGNCVRIIHGRGLGSQGEPVLKRMTRAWLAHHPDVLAYCESADGGALIVLLRRMTD